MRTILSILITLFTLTSIKAQIVGSTFEDGCIGCCGFELELFHNGTFSSSQGGAARMIGWGYWTYENKVLTITSSHDSTDIERFILKDSLTLTSKTRYFSTLRKTKKWYVNNESVKKYEYDFKLGLTLIKTYNKNNILINWTELDGNKKNEKVFNSLGVLQSMGTWKKNRKIGEWFYYNEIGELVDTKKHK